MNQPFYRRLTTFFSRWELWYHILMMPILFPIGNYYFVGPRYFSDWPVFVQGTAVVFGLYWFSVIALTLAVRWVIYHYPDVQRATLRTLVMLSTVGLLTVVLAVLDVFTYSLFPKLEVPFSWNAIRPILILGLIFDLCFCVALNVFYTYNQWHRDQAENELLRQTALQHQLDTLKMKINPHFLFNSLTSLSSLIGEDQKQAELFVDQLSKVYRYMLQANTHELVSLQTELDFAGNYANLLQTRYGASLRISQRTDAVFPEYVLPPLTMQTLIDNAIKHNVMSPTKPLLIEIETNHQQLIIRNNVQRKAAKMNLNQSKLADLMTKFRQLGRGEVQIEETPTHFGVSIPLLNAAYPIPPK